MDRLPQKTFEHVRKPGPYALLALLGAMAFTIGTVLQIRVAQWAGRSEPGGLLQTVLGNGRRLFANHFFVQADVYFHSGYYPSVFDAVPRNRDRSHLRQKEHDHDDQSEEPRGDAPAQDESSQHEKEMAFLREPQDWIDRFGRRFMVTSHQHLEGGKEREMLPWLKIAAELDPEQPETYLVAAYWLRDLKRTDEAEKFLREGLRHLPNSHELYFDLGTLFYEDRKNMDMAANLWELALKKWQAAESAEKKPDPLHLNQIATHLAKLEETRGNTGRAIELLVIAKKVSPHPEAVQTWIEELGKGGPRTIH